MRPLRPSHAPVHHLRKSITQLPAKDRLRAASACLTDGRPMLFIHLDIQIRRSSSFILSFIYSSLQSLAQQVVLKCLLCARNGPGCSG